MKSFFLYTQKVKKKNTFQISEFYQKLIISKKTCQNISHVLIFSFVVCLQACLRHFIKSNSIRSPRIRHDGTAVLCEILAFQRDLFLD